MRIAITGATGFVGRHLARSLALEGHHVVLVSRGVDQRDPSVRRIPHACYLPVSVLDTDGLAAAFAGCDAVAHCAGINREQGAQTYRRVHVEGTATVVRAAQRAGVRRLALMSFLHARPRCGSPYHESKFAAEEVVRASGLDYTVLKAGVLYGKGDHLLDHLSHSLHTLPLFATVGLRSATLRPVAIEDAVAILRASLVEGRLARRTVSVVGPEEMDLAEVVRRVAAVTGRRPLLLRMPVWFHCALAWTAERLMRVPLLALAQVRMIAEGIAVPLPGGQPLPPDLLPRRRFTAEQIRQGLPGSGRFGLRDLRCAD